MANYTALKALINQDITTNGQGDITGAILNQLLKDIVDSLGADYQFVGVATPSTNPGNPDQRVFYLATTAGTYINFNSLVVANGLTILKFDTAWTSEVVYTLDATPTSGSNNPIKSGAVFSALNLLSLRAMKPVYSAGSIYIDSANNKLRILQSNGSDADIYIPNKETGVVGALNTATGGYNIPQPTGDYFHISVLVVNDAQTDLEFVNAYEIGDKTVVAVLLTYDNGFNSIAYSAIRVFDNRVLSNSLAAFNLNNDKQRLEWISSNSSLYITNLQGTTYTITIPAGTTINYPVSGYLYSLVYNTISGNIELVSNNMFLQANRMGKHLVILANIAFNDGAARVSYSTVSYTIDHDAAGRFLTDERNSTIYFANSVKKVFFETPYYRTNNDKLILNCFNGAYNLVTKGHSVAYPTTYYEHMYLCYDWDNQTMIWKQQTTYIYLPIIAQVTFDVTNQKAIDIITHMNYVPCFGDTVKNKFVFGPFGNYGVSATGLTANTKRAGQLTVLTVPYKGAKVKFHLADPDLVGAFRNGELANNLDHNDYWYPNGTELDLAATSMYYRAVFAITNTADRYTYDDIDTSYLEAMINGGDVVIEFEGGPDIFERALANDSAIKAAMLQLTATPENNVLGKLPTFMQVTDVHGDIYRMGDAMCFAEQLGIDAVLATGDIIAYEVSNRWDALENIMLGSKVPVCFCRGNHETYGNSDSSFNVFSTYYQKLASKWSYLKTTSVTDATYYYKDFASKKIRVIALNPYERAIIRNNYGCFSQAQINWFISTLLSTPADYGVVCILHSPESNPYTQVSISKITGKDNFFLEGTPSYWTTPRGINGTPLKAIVDAFISKTSISTSFTQTNDSSQSETITVSGNFANVASGVEFICWVCGHQHIDLIGQYQGTTNKQLVLDSASTICFYGSASYPYLVNGYDAPRGDHGITQDAINIFSIDRTNKLVKIGRLGTNMTLNGTIRQFLSLSYV